MFTKKSSIAALCGLLMILSFSCSKKDSSNLPSTPGGVTGNTVSITGKSFPATFTVKVGTTVKWTNNDSMAHTVTSDNGSTFDSANLPVGATFSYKATTAGSYNYHCDYHSGMTGTLVVQN